MTTFATTIATAAVLAALASQPAAAGDRSIGTDPAAGLQIRTAGATGAMDDPLFQSLTPLSDTELGAVEGGRFRFRFNIAIVPQINICILCFGVSQSNQAYVWQLFGRR